LHIRDAGGNFRAFVVIRADTLRGKAKVKVQVTLEEATKTQRGSTGIALLFPLPRL